MMNFSISLEKIVKQMNLRVAYTPKDLKDIPIQSADVNRPGLLLTGYDEYFDRTRIQILGNAEMGYLHTLPENERRSHVHTLFSMKPPAVIVTRDLNICDAIFEFAQQYQVPVLSSSESTSSMMSGLISILSVDLAPRITRHGVLVEVYGEGLLILGESGVGKSETAIELVKRGHRLIADDAVELRRVSDRTILGTAPENIRHFIELRGVGIINVARVFGSGAIKMSEKIDLVVHLEPWDKTKNYSRTGLETDTTDILGLPLPSTVIPVMPGRNLAVILEAAAINNRQKKMGYNAAQDLLARLGLENDVNG
ncbi:HPr(Ser) kinase/phosphatase [Ruthenibacterium sp. CLA-JM-H11]|uniref:HPr kinase/phosphorylase n=1 Tax=Ruthenibacterium intestinale TaxID=3133163 RepID=A0ABV1GFU3_9FIRM